MARAQANGVVLEYERAGDHGRPAVVLIMGLGAQLVRWPDSLVAMLVERGFHVVRFDNRDCGLSTALSEAGAPDFAAVISGELAPPYTLGDMAKDVIGLLDRLAIASAHLVGVSMGGMIAQIIATDYPDRALSLTSIMSGTGNPSLTPPGPTVFARLTAPGPSPDEDLEAFLEDQLERALVIASPGFPSDPATVLARIRLETERRYDPDCVSRQMAALWTSGDRRAELAKVSVPTVVLHGADDPLMRPDSAEDTASSIRGAELRIVPGMGHDLPETLMPAFCDAICAAASRSADAERSQASR